MAVGLSKFANLSEGWQTLPIDPAELGSTCASLFQYVSDWDAGVFTLPAGTYELVTVWSQSRPVNDGWHTCVDLATGEPLAYPPSLFRPEAGTWTVTIVERLPTFRKVGNLAETMRKLKFANLPEGWQT